MVTGLLDMMNLSTTPRPIPDAGMQPGWYAYWFPRPDGAEPPVRVVLLRHKARGILGAKRQIQGLSNCVALFHLKSSWHMFFRSGPHSAVFGLDSDDAYEHIQTLLSTSGFDAASGSISAMLAIKKIINNIPTTTKNFNNRGVFSTHYLKTRLLDDISHTCDMAGLEAAWDGNDVLQTLGLLGWDDLEYIDGVYRSQTHPGAAILVVERGPDFGILRDADSAAPSYRAVAELKNTAWVILTDGVVWRLYTSRVSASTTNYFEINLGTKKSIILRYLASIFGAHAYGTVGKAGIDVIFDEGKNYVRELEGNISDRILSADGVFVDLVKGTLNHDGTRLYTREDLTESKETALKIMYRLWFILYAESRDLLPVRDGRYTPLSLLSIKNGLDGMEQKPDDHDCWDRILELFDGIRNGSPEHNLPQYNGDLFKHDPQIDSIVMPNRHFVRALRGLVERDGEPVDYASLGVRHLGNIYETLMEFTVRQADRDIVLVEDGDTVREVASKLESAHTYKKNDIYIISKTGSMSRKSSGSYYTPEEIVTFLVRRGLEPIFEEREGLIGADLKLYKKNPTDKNHTICMDRLLDIQVLDPAMGSGHFLVEALNQITQWATGMLERHPEHPLLHEIENDRKTIMNAQKERGIKINSELLTHDVLLKRRIMKRCIFGVDINPLAVELARVSLWLDSFAIGVPLTYLNHHIKAGDSTIGVWRKDVENVKDRSLDDWMSITDHLGDVISQVSHNADVTIQQVRASEDAHDEYNRKMASYTDMLDVYCAAQIEPDIIPKTKNVMGYIRRFSDVKLVDKDMRRALDKARYLRNKHGFFHWELEMMDAFTDARYGFDLIVGNPPYDKIKPNDDEFFTRYYPAFKSLDPKPKKDAKKAEILEDPMIKKEYSASVTAFKQKSMFYTTCELQGVGDRDLSKLLLERMFALSPGGVISVLLPSQILSNAGSAAIRAKILDSNIRQLYVFENRKKIFPIHSSYRLVLLTMRNVSGPDAFGAGFYLHHLDSLKRPDMEKDKFHTLSKNTIRTTSPDILDIPEVGGAGMDIVAKMSTNPTLGAETKDGWSVAFSAGFHRTNDADLLKEDQSGWPVLEGRNIHQFNHRFAKPKYTASKSAGLEREKRKRVYGGYSREFYHSFRLVFRDISSPTNMRTVIAAIIPPQRFYTNALRSVVLARNEVIQIGNDYNRHMAYLCGVINSTSFDFVARSKAQMHTSTILKTIPMPDHMYYDEVAKLAAKLSVGADEFAGFAESLRVENIQPPPLSAYISQPSLMH